MTSLGARPTGFRPRAFAAITDLLVALNVGVTAMIYFTGGTSSPLLYRLMLLPLGRCIPAGRYDMYYPGLTQAQCLARAGTTWLPGVTDGAYWQLLTSAFTHVDLLHIGFNMLALLALGPQLEQVLGRLRFLTLYLVSGVAGSVLAYVASDPRSATLGASGAVFGLMGALLIIAIKTRADVRTIVIWLAINAAVSWYGRASISWQGHLGGFIAGLVLATAVAYAPPQSRRTALAASSLVILVVCAAGVLLRAQAILAG